MLKAFETFLYFQGKKISLCNARNNCHDRLVGEHKHKLYSCKHIVMYLNENKKSQLTSFLVPEVFHIWL